VTTKVFPFKKVQEAYKAMTDGQFRVVMSMDEVWAKKKKAAAAAHHYIYPYTGSSDPFLTC
jgi:hypothetical protein